MLVDSTKASLVHLDHDYTLFKGPKSAQAPTEVEAEVETPHTEYTPPTLLTLPGEIRNQIYRLLLTIPPTTLKSLQRHVHLNHYSGSTLSSSPTSSWPFTPALLSTCRQISSEATPILYAENTFTAHPTLLTSMPYLVNPARPIYLPQVCERIRRWHVSVRLDCDARYREEDVTQAFSGAQEVEVEAKEAMFRSAGAGMLMLFRGVRGVERARVMGSVEREFAVWLEGAMMAEMGSEVDETGIERFLGRNVWTGSNR